VTLRSYTPERAAAPGIPRGIGPGGRANCSRRNSSVSSAHREPRNFRSSGSTSAIPAKRDCDMVNGSNVSSGQGHPSSRWNPDSKLADRPTSAEVRRQSCGARTRPDARLLRRADRAHRGPASRAPRRQPATGPRTVPAPPGASSRPTARSSPPLEPRPARRWRFHRAAAGQPRRSSGQHAGMRP
jgi:hypothetical protein